MKGIPSLNHKALRKKGDYTVRHFKRDVLADKKFCDEIVLYNRKIGRNWTINHIIGKARWEHPTDEVASDITYDDGADILDSILFEAQEPLEKSKKNLFETVLKEDTNIVHTFTEMLTNFVKNYSLGELSKKDLEIVEEVGETVCDSAISTQEAYDMIVKLIDEDKMTPKLENKLYKMIDNWQQAAIG